jgi:pimeloyl-ACP methyl ester carboxylesterase
LVIANLAVTLVASRPGDASQSCQEFIAGMENPPLAALAWCGTGEYSSWRSTLTENAGFEALNFFHICPGNPDDLAVLMIHGCPTSSLDYADLARELSDDHYVCALDTPGHGLTDKPKKGYEYSIYDNAFLVDEYIRHVVRLDKFVLVTHDKDDSVALAPLQI